jgi:hypothetical protein
VSGSQLIVGTETVTRKSLGESSFDESIVSFRSVRLALIHSEGTASEKKWQEFFSLLHRLQFDDEFELRSPLDEVTFSGELRDEV